MKIIDKKTLENLRKQYPPGTRVELVKTSRSYNTILISFNYAAKYCVFAAGMVYF